MWGVIGLVPGVATKSLSAVPLPFNIFGGSQALPAGFQLNIATLMLAWATTEVIRYAYYGFKLSSRPCPYALEWLRYTTFLVLYPLGVASELAMLWLAYPQISRYSWCSLYDKDLRRLVCTSCQVHMYTYLLFIVI